MGTKPEIEKIDLSTENVPLLPLRDVVVFPHTVMPLFVGRETSINAITQSMGTNKYIFLVTQKDDKVENPEYSDLHEVGTLATILQMLKLPDGTIKVLVEGIKRAKVEAIIELDDYSEVQLSELSLSTENETEVEAMMRLALSSFEKYIKLNKKIPEEVLKMLKDVSDVERFSDVIIANLSLKVSEKQTLLGGESAQDRLDKILTVIQSEIEVLDTEHKI